MSTIYEPQLHGSAPHVGGPVGLTMSTVHDDVSFADVLAIAHIEDAFDGGGFQLFVGFDEHGQVAYYIQNLVPGGAHMVVSVPLDAAEWLKRAGV